MNRFAKTVWLTLAIISSQYVLAQKDPKLTEIWEPEPVIITPGINASPPSDAIILFAGDDLSEWTDAKDKEPRWTVEEGIVTVNAGTGGIKTRKKFGDCQLHIEFRTPDLIKGEGQGRGNSGVFLQERYEVQVLDSYNNRTYSNGQAASVYKQHIPLVNASKPPGEWQTYDIFFTAPRFTSSGDLETPAFVTVIHNGVLVQNHVEIKGPTAWIGNPPYEAHGTKEPIFLQDHGNPVSYRNIWIRELNPISQNP